MPKLTEKTRILALAYLHQGKSPRDTEELVPDLSYGQALRLSKELAAASSKSALAELFNLEEAVLESVLEQTNNELSEAAEILTGDVVPLAEAVNVVGKGIESQSLLEIELSDAAREITKAIKLKASTTHNADTIVQLAEALSKMQTAFFKYNNINIANFEEGGLESLLTK